MGALLATADSHVHIINIISGDVSIRQVRPLWAVRTETASLWLSVKTKAASVRDGSVCAQTHRSTTASVDEPPVKTKTASLPVKARSCPDQYRPRMSGIGSDRPGPTGSWPRPRLPARSGRRGPGRSGLGSGQAPAPGTANAEGGPVRFHPAGRLDGRGGLRLRWPAAITGRGLGWCAAAGRRGGGPASVSA